MLQTLQPNDMPRRKEFALNMLQRISEDEAFLERVCFSDEATFHVSGKLNKHNVRIWESVRSKKRCISTKIKRQKRILRAVISFAGVVD